MKIPPHLPVAARKAPEQAQSLRDKAVALEAEFLTEMLRHAGLGESSKTFGGGIGEEQFASFLRREQATALAHAGGIGLAETLFKALEKSSHDH